MANMLSKRVNIFNVSKLLRYDILVMALAIFCWSCNTPSRTDKNIFNGTDLSGWSSSNMQYWSVMDSAIVGKVPDTLVTNQFLWSPIEVTDFYLSLEVKLDSASENAGIQFRSSKADSTGQAKGYQADVGYSDGNIVWGMLYDEHGRGLLDGSDPAAKAVKAKEWNQYEILAVGSRIWIAVNGIIGAAVNDPGGKQSGYIALQIHSGPRQTVHYKIKQLVHNPSIELAGHNQKQLEDMLKKPLTPAEGQSVISVRDNSIIVFAGGTNISNMQSNGYLETLLAAAFPKKHLRFRNLAWEGDTVFEQFRDIGFGDWKKNIDSLDPDIVFLQFGQMEVLNGKNGLDSFKNQYTELLNEIAQKDRTIILLSPVRVESFVFDSSITPARANPLSRYSFYPYLHGISTVAQLKGCIYIDLYHPLNFKAGGPLTYDGIHLNDNGQQMMAKVIMEKLRLPLSDLKKLEAVRETIVKKNELWFSYWRPGNWAFLYGDRSHVPFSRDWRDYNNRIFPQEMKQFEPIIKAAESKIDQQLAEEL